MLVVAKKVLTRKKKRKLSIETDCRFDTQNQRGATERTIIVSLGSELDPSALPQDTLEILRLCLRTRLAFGEPSSVSSLVESLQRSKHLVQVLLIREN